MVARMLTFDGGLTAVYTASGACGRLAAGLIIDEGRSVFRRTSGMSTLFLFLLLLLLLSVCLSQLTQKNIRRHLLGRMCRG